MTSDWCKLDGCDRRRYVRGWCRHHYESWLAHGDPLVGRWRSDAQYNPLVCDCPTPTPEHIALFGAWQCSVCYRKCEAPTAAGVVSRLGDAA